LCLAREPRSAELVRLREFVQQQRQRFEGDKQAAADFAPKPVPDNVTTVEAATWTAVARVLLNLDEFITRE
jgi:hypothetical protein